MHCGRCRPAAVRQHTAAGAIGGAPLRTAAVVLTGFGAGELVRRAVPGGGPPGRRTALVVPALLAVGPVIAGLLASLTVATTTIGGQAVVALIQGNVPRAGLDFNAQRRAVLDNHAARTIQLAAAGAAGRYQRPALVISPATPSELDPLTHPPSA